MGRGTREKGTAGDHKGPPSRSPPPSPLRADEHVSKTPTREMGARGLVDVRGLVGAILSPACRKAQKTCYTELHI